MIIAYAYIQNIKQCKCNNVKQLKLFLLLQFITRPPKMKLTPCLLLMCALSMTVTGVPLPTTHDAHHHHLQHNLNMTEYNHTQANHTQANHTEGRNLLVSMLLAPKRSPPFATPKPDPKPATVAATKHNPKSDPKPAPNSAPKSAPNSAPKSAPNSAPKSALNSAPKSAPPKVSVNVIAPIPIASSPKVLEVKVAPFPILMTCDNEFDLYVGGKKVGKGNSWTTTYDFSPIVNPGDVIAIDGVDHDGPAAFIGVFNGKVTKPADWKCTTTKFSKWNENAFDDSAWPRAVSFSRNQDNNIWRSVGGGSRPKIPGDAEWLWTSDNNNHNRVYCRYTPAVITPLVAPVAAKVVAPVAAKVVAPVAAKVVVSPTASSKSSHSSSRAKDVVIGDVNNMHTRIVGIIHETQTLQKREINQNKQNVNISQTDLNKFILKQDEDQMQLQRLQALIIQTNQSIARHYAQMNADSLYLQKLDMIKPQFMQTLDATNAHFTALFEHVSKLMNDEHKKEMLDILNRARNATVYDTRDLAQSFLAHYEKYKNVLRTESNTYSQDLLNLKDLTQRYASGQTEFTGLKAEVARLRSLVASLKMSVSASEADASLFVQIEKIISDILSSKKTNFVTDGANNECAVSILKTHVSNGLI